MRKDVEFSPGSAPETYHAFKQADYVGILALTADGRIPLVQQYRPAIESYTWEFPGGIMDADESPEECCRRELLEEAGLEAVRVVHLGTQPAEVGRLENRHHMFFVEATQSSEPFVPEPGVRVEFVSRPELDQQIVDGRFCHPLHVALLFLHDLTLRLNR